jgi:hypothetical protein
MLKKYEETDIASIATAIREKTGGEKAYKVSQMSEGVNEVYEAGKKAEYDAFWLNYVNPRADDLDYMFAGQRWTNTIFKPPSVTLKPRRAMYMFARSGIIGDLAQIFNDLGFAVDFSNCVYIDDIFNNSAFTRIGELNFSGAVSSANRVFINAKVVTIDKIIVSENTKSLNAWFSGCTDLENITFEGTINKNIDFKDCTKLTRASIDNIYAHLKPDTEFTVTLSKTAVNNAYTTDEWEELVSRLPYITFSLI